MSWTNKYWDIVDHFFWAPQYLGLKSISRKDWKIEGEMVSIPREMTHSTGPLYRRIRSGDEYWKFVRRQEETFNHIFDLTFAILPGDVVCDLLDQFTSVGCGHNYESLGRELFDRYSWGNKNVTAPDGFFVARDSVLAVELKFNAITSLDQLAKYLTLFVVEELFAGKREHLDLLYIFHSNPHASFTTQTGFAPDEINGNITDTLVDAGKGQFVRKILGDNREAMNDVLERIKIHCISWADFRNALVAFAGELENGQGDRTLRRLIDGLATAIAEHPLSNVEEPCDATRIRQPTKSSKTTADHTPKPTHLIR